MNQSDSMFGIYAKLSDRQLEVVEGVCKGLSNREIGAMLFIAEKSVKFHLTNIFRLRNVKSRGQLIVQENQRRMNLPKSPPVLEIVRPTLVAEGILPLGSTMVGGSNG